MRAERFGSYSIARISATTPCFFRLKSTIRYFLLCPPPRWRMVRRPALLRPPVRFRTAVKVFSGLSLVISEKPGSDLNRLDGVSGLKFLSAIVLLDELDLVALLQRHHRFFPIRPPPEASGPLALFLAGEVRGVDVN